MNDDTPKKGIAVTATGLICQCGNTNEDLIVPHLEIISRRKDVRGQWFEKTKDFLKCSICGELQLLDDDFIKARKQTYTPVLVESNLTPKNVKKVVDKMHDILKERMPEHTIITNNMIKEEIVNKIDAKLSDKRVSDDGVLSDAPMVTYVDDFDNAYIPAEHYEKPKKKRKKRK
jgi:hypothetical protein